MTEKKNERRKLKNEEILKLDLLNEIKKRKNIEKEFNQLQKSYLELNKQLSTIQMEKSRLEVIILNYQISNNKEKDFDSESSISIEELENWFKDLKDELQIKDDFSFDRETGLIQDEIKHE